MSAQPPRDGFVPWKCVHCPLEIPSIPVAVVTQMKVCPSCAGEQVQSQASDVTTKDETENKTVPTDSSQDDYAEIMEDEVRSTEEVYHEASAQLPGETAVDQPPLTRSDGESDTCSIKVLKSEDDVPPVVSSSTNTSKSTPAITSQSALCSTATSSTANVNAASQHAANNTATTYRDAVRATPDGSTSTNPPERNSNIVNDHNNVQQHGPHPSVHFSDEVVSFHNNGFSKAGATTTYHHSGCNASTFSNPAYTGQSSGRLWANTADYGYPYNIRGLRTNGEKAVSVTFNVIVPLDHWMWDHDSSIHLRFGVEELGDWNVDIGDFTVFRRISNSRVWMRSTIYMATDLFKWRIPYKYLVYSPRAKDMSDPWEFLLGYRDSNTNRCLEVPVSQRKYGSNFSVYDAITFPKESSYIIVEAVKAGMEAIGLYEKKDKAKLKEAQEEALECFLSEQAAALEDYTDVFNFSKIVGEINHIYEQLRVQKTLVPIRSAVFNEHLADYSNVTEAFRKWLFAIADILQQKSSGTMPGDNGKRMCSVFVILKLLDKMSYNKPDRVKCPEVINIFSMLFLMPDAPPSSQKCHDWQIISSRISEEDQRDIARILVRIINLNLPAISGKLAEWICAIPLVHLLEKRTKPFARPAMTSGDIQWTIERHINFCDLKSRAILGVITEHRGELLKECIRLDPLLLPLLVNCVHNHLKEVLPFIPLYISAATLSELPYTSKKKEASLNFIEVVEKLTDIMKNSSFSFDRHEEILSILGEVQVQTCEVISGLDKSSVHLKIMHRMLTLFLYTASKLKECLLLDATGASKTSIVLGMFEEVSKCLAKKWFWRNFSHAFGRASNYMGDVRIPYSKDEIKAFEGLATIDCPKDLQQDWWQNVLEKILRGRMARIPDKLEWRIELMVILESLESPHHIITNAVTETVIMSFETKGTPGGAHVEKLYRVASRHKKLVRKVLSKIFAKEFPDDVATVSLNSLLNWEMWPICLSIHKNEAFVTSSPASSVIESCLPDKYRTLCKLATRAFDDYLKKVKDGSISFVDMEGIAERRNQFESLYLARKQREQHKLGEIKSVLDTRHTECQAFKTYKGMLYAFCHKLESEGLSINGLPELNLQIFEDHLKEPLNLLCSTDDTGTVQFRSYSAAQPLQPLLLSYHYMSCVFPNGLFTKIWSSRITDIVQAKKDLDIVEVKDEVWSPVLEECSTLLNGLESESIKLKYIDYYFREDKHILSNLTKLYRAVEICKDTQLSKDEIPIPDWVREVMKRIQQYWSLCEQAEAARNLLSLKDRLKLTGDFGIIRKVASQGTESMKDSSLKSINQEVMDAKEFLKEITDDKKKLECLNSFVACMSLVEWIGRITTDVNDLDKFVDVALHTAAGEGDEASDKLSDLKTVGSGYGPLIYDLPKNSSYDAFQKGCTAVWKFMKEAPNLPQLLVECDKELGWYESVKKTQASVEVTSFDQMNTIFSYGCYSVGSAKAQICHSYHEVIQLTLREKDGEKRLTKKKYTLEELRDLESKLVLITGSKEKNRAQVDTFIDTLHSVCRIAEVLLTLQEVGNVCYTGWVLYVPCSTNKKIVGELRDLAREMEHKLLLWKEKVKQQRQNYYELNYYTMKQLLTLRKELGKLKNHKRGIQVSSEVISLLHSISSQVTPNIIQDMVTNCVANTELSLEQQKSSSGDYMGSEADDTAMHSCELVASVGSQVSLGSKKSTDSSVVKKKHHDEPETCLTQEQIEMMSNICVRLNCSEKLVKRSFEECPEKGRYDFERWCLNHLDEDKPGIGDSESSSEWEDDDDDSDSSDEDLESQGRREFKYISVTEQKKANSQLVPSKPCSVKIVRAKKKMVDENHPIVQQLVLIGYSMERSIDAVARYGTQEGALTYLGSAEEENEDMLFSVTVEESPNDSFKMQHEGPPTVYSDPEAEERYLKLEYLGELLRQLSSQYKGEVRFQRTFSTDYLKKGYPNLLVVPPDDVLRATLSLYMENHVKHPLPTSEEVLVCTAATTAEEIELFWMRAIHDPNYLRIFCLVHAERLSYQVSDHALSSLSRHSQGKQDYHLVIICSSKGEEMSHFISKLHLFKRYYIYSHEAQDYQKYLLSKFTKQYKAWNVNTFRDEAPIPASVVDCEGSSVRLIKSFRSGMGKSLYTQRLAEALQKKLDTLETVHVTIPVHGPVVTPDSIMTLMKNHLKKPACYIYHIDIAPTVLWQVDTILFSLLILRGLCDSQGLVWNCRPDQLYAVEVTLPSAMNDPEMPESPVLSLLELLPGVICLSPRDVTDKLEAGSKENKLQILIDNGEYLSEPYQRVYQYIRRYSVGFNLDSYNFVPASKNGCLADDGSSPSTDDFLRLILRHCGVTNPSWSVLRHFIEFLSIQLQSCQNSGYIDLKNADGTVLLAGLKCFVVKFMLWMSKDFSVSSLQSEVVIDAGKRIKQGDLEVYQIDGEKMWEKSPHPYLFFNKDRERSMTFVGFVIDDRLQLVNPMDKKVLDKSIMSASLYSGLRSNGVNFQDDYCNWKKEQMIEKMATVMGIKNKSFDPDSSYVLTVDNCIKILAIQMRFRCGIPVVIMGETGCGKTRLIRYMCDLARRGLKRDNMLILKIHGGTTEEDIGNFITNAELECKENEKLDLQTVVFFDEANTTDAIGLIKEIMCDRRINGRSINKKLKFIAACNPYRRHDENMIKRLEEAGLGFFVKATETQQKLGKIPLRQLVYRVLDLPQSMRSLVYDFGQLKTDTEGNYIKQIVRNHIGKYDALSDRVHELSQPIAEVLTWSQDYMRKRKDECSFVSLRDVERAMIVFEYMYKMVENVFGSLMDEWGRGKKTHVETERKKKDRGYESPGSISRALILSLSVCYHARLQNRKEFEDLVVGKFVGPISLPGGVEQFRNEIKWCQMVLLDSMELEDNIARNAALRENVFMMAICIELRIPLFLVGKPGSSKSLAKSIISESMKGKKSKKKLLNRFNEVGIFSYQCSQLSTSESVIEVFHNAKKFQEKQDKSSYVAVVVLDEVGLAEDSPNLPLKALHPLLEDGTDGTRKDYKDQIIDRNERVAFVGISNWALDPAKMNRGVMVTRADPSEDELVFSAKGICSKEDVDDPVKRMLEDLFRPFAKAYMTICEKQKREFFGLRDFYSLIKMLYHMCAKSNLPPTWPQLEHAIKRNFGGLESENWNPFEIFENAIGPLTLDVPILDVPEVSEEVLPIVRPDCSRLGLIKTSLNSREKTWHGENRYVLFLTENYAALDILKNPKNYLTDTTELDIKEGILDKSFSGAGMEPFILFGSSFPKDRQYTQVCRNINQIKICMETGRTAILLNLENLYESLYDVLNQYYICHGNRKYVDLGLQTHRVRCRVHDNFKLILIAEKDTVYEKFPTPLINRMEKHFILTSSILKDWQVTLLRDFEDWIKKFSNFSTPGLTFKSSDTFIGFQKDTPASVIFQSTNQLREACTAARKGIIERKLESVLQWSRLDPKIAFSYGEENLQEGYHKSWEEAVLILGKYLLLMTAAPDAIIRVAHTALADEQSSIKEIYFQHQNHASLMEFLQHHVNDQDRDCAQVLAVSKHHSSVERDASDNNQQLGQLMQVTTHSYLFSPHEMEQFEADINIKVASFFLHEFDTELDFSNKISPMFKLHERRLVVIQCESGNNIGDLIACARYRIYDLRAKADYGQITHVLFVVQLPRYLDNSSFVGFQGDPWISAHIDDIRPTTNNTVSTSEASGWSISELFMGKRTEKIFSPRSVPAGGFLLAEMTGPVSIVKEERDIEVEDIIKEDVKEKYINGGDMKVEDIEGIDLEADMEVEGIKGKDFGGVNMETEGVVEEEEVMTASMRTSSPRLTGELKSKLRSKLHTSRPMFRRLHGCIQAAASRLKDSTSKRCIKRVEILVLLIPKDPPNDPDYTEFYGMLIQRIHDALQERDKFFTDKREWIIQEAMDAKKIQFGGTFRNVLSRKLDDIVIPIFSEIVSVMDQHFNLNLISPSNVHSSLFKFWLGMFGDPDIVKFSYCEPREQVPGVSTQEEGDFECQLPFSWLVHETVTNQWDNARSNEGNDKSKLHEQLYLDVEITAIGEVLKSVDESDSDEFYRRYLHDFLRMVHHCSHKLEKHRSREYELLTSSLDALVHGDLFPPKKDHSTLLAKITALHVVFDMSKSQVLWFGQLVSHTPGIMYRLSAEDICDNNEMILHLCAVEKALDNLSPPLKYDDKASDINPWLNEVRTSQNAIASILHLPCQSKIKEKAQLEWNKIRMHQLFMEHVLLKHHFENDWSYLVRLNMFSDAITTFKDISVLRILLKHLNFMDQDIKSIMKGKERKHFRRHSHDFFIDVISTLCFGGSEPPQSDLVKELMRMLFVEDKDVVSPISEGKMDEVSVLKSSLLQLLLEHNTDSVKDHLEEYFVESKKALQVDTDSNFYLLCIQCLEDALYKEHSTLGLEARLNSIINLLGQSNEVLNNYQINRNISVKYLEGVARARFALAEAASILFAELSDDDTGKSAQVDHLETNLIENAKILCTNSAINDVNAEEGKLIGPAVFLIKLLVRQHGFACLKRIIKSEEWIIPEELHSINDFEPFDPFVIYGGSIDYLSMRDVIHETVTKKETGRLKRVIEKAETRNDAAMLILSLYESISDCDSDDASFCEEVLSVVKEFSLSSHNVAKLLLANQQGGPLNEMEISPDQPVEFRILGGIVIHTVAVFGSVFENPVQHFLLPFINMLTNPKALVSAFLPAMPENVQPAAGEKKKYADGRPDSGEKEAYTDSGHLLGNPDFRTGPPAPERSLSPLSICIMRALIHSAFLWYSCHADDVTDLAGLVKHNYNLQPEHLPEFFWKHLYRDIQQLSRSTGKGLEEATVIVHLVLKNIFTEEPPTSKDVAVVNTLCEKAARDCWEREFNALYINPILGSLNCKLDRVIDLVAEDQKQEHGPLFYLSFEKKDVDDIEPHLWSYRQRISLEHLNQTLQQRKFKEKYPILHEFLRLEPILRATQYLPDIVKLQRSLYDAFHHRLDRKKAREDLIGQFIAAEKNEVVRKEYAGRVESLKKAWALVGSNLKTKGCLNLEDIQDLPNLTDEVSLEYFIPTKSGPGALTTALVEYLIEAHNGFITFCREKVEERTKSEWAEQKIPATQIELPVNQIHLCHLLDYEQQIVSVVLSHCCYSLKMGEAHTVQYDHQALEKHILDKFIQGKPLIKLSSTTVLQVMYRKDVHTTAMFEIVRKKVYKQEKMEFRVRKEILKELRTPARICGNLDVVDIVLGFLSLGGGKAEKSLGEYIDKVLKMKERPFSNEARRYCKLKHIISLWETLSVELARLTCLRNQNQQPFDFVEAHHLQELSEDHDNNQKAELDKCLRPFDLERLLGALFEFIEVHLKCIPKEDLSQKLVDVLRDEKFRHLEMEDRFYAAGSFPCSIVLSQTVAVWKHIVFYQEKMKPE